mgnify:CR=1 FL=1
MTILELNTKYSFEDLEQMPGNGKLRYKLFPPVFKDLHENKIIYYERFVCVAILEEINFTEERFSAKAVPLLKIKGVGVNRDYLPEKPWTFGASWEYMRLTGDCFGTYGSWLIWTDKVFVKHIESLVIAGNLEEAMNLTIYKNK